MIAEDEDESSKTEEPSERKISKAKEEGDIAISQDAKSFIMLIGMLFVIWLILPLMFKWFYIFSLRFIETPEAIPTDGRHLRLLMYECVLALIKILGIPFLYVKKGSDKTYAKLFGFIPLLSIKHKQIQDEK